MATIYPRGDVWYLNYSDARGQHRKSMGKISEHLAKVRLKQKEYELSMGINCNSHSAISFKEYATIYLTWYEETYPSSFQLVLHVVLDFEKYFNMLLNKVSQKDIDTAIKNLKERGLKPATINRKTTTLKAMFSRAKRDGFLVADVEIEKIPELNSKPPKYYSKKELKMIYEFDKETEHWWKFLANTGLRLDEFYNLKCENITETGIYVISTDENRNKSKKWRKIPISMGVDKVLKDFDLTQEYLFPRYSDKTYYNKKFRRLIMRIKGISKSKRGIHCLRHSFASHLVMSGASLFEVKKLLGHSKIETTEVYAHLSDAHLSKSVSNFNI